MLREVYRKHRANASMRRKPPSGAAFSLFVDETIRPRTLRADSGRRGHPARRGRTRRTFDATPRGKRRPDACRHGKAFSFQAAADDQAETDRLRHAIVDGGGRASACGRCTDRWGLPWQIIPRALKTAIGDGDPAAARRAFETMMGMTKIDIAAIEAARRGGRRRLPTWRQKAVRAVRADDGPGGSSSAPARARRHTGIARYADRLRPTGRAFDRGRRLCIIIPAPCC